MLETVGRATLAHGMWEITAEPHVMMHVKRIFPSVDKTSTGKVKLSDTPEHGAELLWFSQRFPLDIKPRIRATMQALKHHEQERGVRAVLSDGYVPPEVDLALPPREYQRTPAALVLKNGGLLLADDLGTGKTISAIATLARAECLPAVVVTMSHLTIQWMRELNRFAPKLRVHVVKEGKPYDLTEGAYDRRLRERRRTPLPDVIVLNYHKLNGWADHLAAEKLGRLVCFDECQELRHTTTDRYAAALKLRMAAKYCIGLSATPIYNYGGEIWAVLNIIKPDFLGTREEFLREWCTAEGCIAPPSTDKKPRVQNPRALGTHLRRAGVMLRRTRAEVGRELPPLQKIVHQIDIDESYLNDVSDQVASLARTILATTGGGFAKMRASADLDIMLRQATGVGKALHVAHFVRMLIENGEQVVLYGWHKAVYAIWRKAFGDPKLGDLKPAWYTGDESIRQKDEARRRFVDRTAEDHTPLIILSLRSGAGLDGLQGTSNVVVHGELDWAPGVHEQGDGRVHRDGQKNSVTSYYLVSDSGSDPIIADILQLKSAQSEGIRNPDQALAKKLESVDPEHVKKLAKAILERRQRGKW